MRFIIDADLPRNLFELCRSFGHVADDVRDIGLGGAPDGQIAARAKADGACLMTGDFGFADIRNYPPVEYAGIVVLEVPSGGTSRTINGMVSGFLARSELLAALPGRLAIVEPGRVRFRPPLGKQP